MGEPRTGRPWMPGYGVPDSLDGALPWSWAEERLVACRNYFLATTRPDGRPHVMPLWGVWVQNTFMFSTSKISVKATNLGANPASVLTTDDGHHSVIVEGTAEVVSNVGVLKPYLDAYERKYRHKLEPDPKFLMTPRVAFALREDETFSTSATRWEF